MIKKIDFVLDYKVKELEEKAYIYLLKKTYFLQET